jgi:peroxiredoxin
MSTTISEQSAQVQSKAAQRLPSDVAEVFARDRQTRVAHGASPDVITAGDVLEEFTLPDANGGEVSLSDLVADGPAVLVFYRGGWCPFCNLALRQYQAELMPQMERYDATLAAISPETPDASLTLADKHALQFPVLSDAGARVARRLGIAFEQAEDVLAAQRALGLDIRAGNAEGAIDLPMPTVLIVDRDRVVRFADVHPDYTTRTEVSTIVSALSELGAVPRS